MAKRKVKKEEPPQEEVRCDYCKHNLGENKRFGYMWHCFLLNHCVVFGLKYCNAYKNGKGNFLKDETKYKEWIIK